MRDLNRGSDLCNVQWDWSLNHGSPQKFLGVVFLIASLAVQKFLSLTRSYLFIFVFISTALRD